MTNKKKRITEPVPYMVSHDEGTRLVESKRVPGEMHSTAYPVDGTRTDRDTVTLREMTPEEVALLAACYSQAMGGGGQSQSHVTRSRATFDNALQAGIDAIIWRMTERGVDYLWGLCEQYGPMVWTKLRQLAKERLSAADRVKTKAQKAQEPTPAENPEATENDDTKGPNLKLFVRLSA